MSSITGLTAQSIAVKTQREGGHWAGLGLDKNFLPYATTFLPDICKKHQIFGQNSVCLAIVERQSRKMSAHFLGKAVMG